MPAHNYRCKLMNISIIITQTFIIFCKSHSENLCKGYKCSLFKTWLAYHPSNSNRNITVKQVNPK